MYESHYGLREKPFAIVPDPEFLYLSRKHAAAFSLLEYALSGQAGFVVISGEVGSGKTTLIRRFLGITERDVTVGLISNTHATFGDLLDWIFLAYGLRDTAASKADRYGIFVDFLLNQYASGRRTVLVVDEAQNMSLEVLEELRLLSNVNADKDLLLQIILVGQPELLDKLRRPDMRQFAQRISAHYHLPALSYPETRAYIRHRLRVAGGNPSLFAELAVAAIHCASSGVPRLINSICDMALVYGFGDARREIDFDIVARVVEQQRWSGLGISAEEVTQQDPLHNRAARLLEQLTPEVLAADQPAEPQPIEQPAAEPVVEEEPAPAIAAPAPETSWASPDVTVMQGTRVAVGRRSAPWQRWVRRLLT